MKRDLDLIRELLLSVEEKASALKSISPVELMDKNHSADVIGFHFVLMFEAGLIKGNFTSGDDNPMVVSVFGLTWSGCEFLDLVREDKRWSKTKEILGGLGGFTFAAAQMALMEALKQNAVPQLLALLR